MTGYPINMGNLMNYNITKAVGKDERSYPYANFLTMYFEDQRVEKKNFDTTTKPKHPFSWYITKGPENPKTNGKAAISTGQSEEPRVLAAESEPSIAEGSSVAVLTPSSGPSISVPLSVPSCSTYPKLYCGFYRLYPVSTIGCRQ